jgi:hypothetical protein
VYRTSDLRTFGPTAYAALSQGGPWPSGRGALKATTRCGRAMVAARGPARRVARPTPQSPASSTVSARPSEPATTAGAPRKRTFTPMMGLSHLMGLSHREYRAPGTGPISRDLSPYIVPDGIEGVLQGGGKSRIHRVRSHRFTGIYRTMQFNNAVQDTERWAD